MADIVIFVSGYSANSETTDDLEYSGTCRCSGMDATDDSITWATAAVAVGALATTVNTAIKDAAIAAAGVAGYTVGGLDKKTLLGGAIGL